MCSILLFLDAMVEKPAKRRRKAPKEVGNNIVHRLVLAHNTNYLVVGRRLELPRALGSA